MSRGFWRGRGPIVVIVGAAFVAYTTHSLLRYFSFHAPAYDLGFFDQLTSNLSAGRGWSSSFVAYDFRGQHWEPILLVWAQLYRVVQSPVWLLVVASAGLAAAPWAAWRLARRWLGEDHPGAVIAALATALSPLVLRAAGFDYHSEALTPVLALLALEAASRRRWLAVAACCAVLTLLKEDAFLVVAGIGWIIFVVERRRAGLLITAVALAGFVAVVGVYMPAVRGGAPSDLLARYAYLGAGGHATTPGAIVTGMATHPSTWVAHLLSAGPLEGLAVALVPLALLPLLSGWALLAPLPPLLLALLSNSPFQSTLVLQYGIEAFPLLLACALLGWRRVARIRAVGAALLARRRLLGAVAVAGVVLAVPLSVDLRGRLNDMTGVGRSVAVNALLSEVPSSASVSASTGLVAHLSDRPEVTEFPPPGSPAFVVIDTGGDVSAKSQAAGYSDAVQRLEVSYRVVARVDGVVLWERT